MLQKPILLLAVSGSTSSRVQIFRHGAARNPLVDILMSHLGKIMGHLQPQPRFWVAPNALDKRTAISREMPAQRR